MLSVQNISKTFGGIKAVDGCSLEVKKGSVTGLIGPNGSGKTTLFNIITGFYPPDSGEIHFNNQPIHKLLPSQICHRGIGRTFQITRLFWKMTVLENMIVPVRQTGWRTLFSQGVKKHEEQRAMADELGADSLIYLPLEAVARCIDLSEDQLCRACITGQYPTPAGTQLYDLALMNRNGSNGRTYEKPHLERRVSV